MPVEILEWQNLAGGMLEPLGAESYKKYRQIVQNANYDDQPTRRKAYTCPRDEYIKEFFEIFGRFSWDWLRVNVDFQRPGQCQKYEQP